MEKVKEQYSMPRCDIEKLKEEIKGMKIVLQDCKRLEDHQRQGVLF